MSNFDQMKNHENASIVNYEINDPFQYNLIKKGKKTYNLNRNKMYKHSHNRIDEFVILPRSNYNGNMFGGSQNYVEFEY